MLSLSSSVAKKCNILTNQNILKDIFKLEGLKGGGGGGWSESRKWTGL